MLVNARTARGSGGLMFDANGICIWASGVFKWAFDKHEEEIQRWDKITAWEIFDEATVDPES